MVDAETAAKRWIDAWSTGWTEHDVDRIVALYADDAVFVSAPFREPKHGAHGVREYVEWAFGEEDQAECRFGEPVVGEQRVAVEYWAVITYQGQEQTLSGVALIRFDDDGRVTEQRDHWHMEDGRRDVSTSG
jgi:ketosteroid isomerase-like protein